MKLNTIRFIILIFGAFFYGCKSEPQVKDKLKIKNKMAIPDKIKTVSRMVEKEILEIPKNELEEQDITENCVFNHRNFFLPKIRKAIGDTINIQNVYDWIFTLKPTDKEKEIKKVTKRGNNFFQINETENFITIGCLEDEGEYLAIRAFSINKKNCEILGKELLAETTDWENGYKETFSIFRDDLIIIREKRTGTKDWGDYTKWKRDTLITKISFDQKGIMKLKEK